MSKVTQFPGRQPEFDLPMEVLGVLMRQAEPTVHEIAHDIEMSHGYRMDSAEFYVALQRLRSMNYYIHEWEDPDGVRYALGAWGGAA